MTLAIGLECDEGIVLASDSRATFGDVRTLAAANDTVQKVHHLTTHSGIVVFGANEVGAVLVEEFVKDLVSQPAIGISRIVESIRKHCQQAYANWFTPFQGQPVPAAALGFIVAGYEIHPEDGTVLPDRKIYLMAAERSFVPGLSNFGFHVAGVPQYAIYLLNRLYTPRMDLHHLARLAAYCISETATQDGRVGGPTQIATITQIDGFRLLSESEVLGINEENHKARISWKSMFSAAKEGDI